MTDNLISWNFANFVTVVLMVTLGYFVLGFALSFVPSNGDANASS